eukprot:gene7330-14955_t
MSNHERWPPYSITHHLYFESSLSPETFAVYNINEKHALDGNLNTSRVQHFVKRLPSQFPFVPDDMLPRIEKLLAKLHYGWCSHAMDLIKGDLQLIRSERAKPDQNDNLIADIGKAIEKLLDTFEIAIGIDDIAKKIILQRAKARGNRAEEAVSSLSDALVCWTLPLVHPESGHQMRPIENGCGLTTSTPSIIQVLNPIDDISDHWQLFFETLTRSYQSASYLVQENIETEKGNLSCSHKPELFKVLDFIRDNEGFVFIEYFKKNSPFYLPVNENKIVINLSSLEQRPYSSNDQDFKTVTLTRIQHWRNYLQDTTSTSISDSLRIKRDELLIPAPQLAVNWEEFINARDRMRVGSVEALTGVWSAFNDRYRYHQLKPLVIRWRWCTHVKRPGRFVDIRLAQIDRELAYIRKELASSLLQEQEDKEKHPGVGTGGSGGGGGGTNGNGSNGGIVNVNSSGTSESSKKKKKKPVPSSTRLSPQDSPLPFLIPEMNADNFVPRRFALCGDNSNGNSISNGAVNNGIASVSPLTAELDRLVASMPKQCGDPYLADEIIDNLSIFPPQIRWLFLQHLSKNPFPDQPFSLINLWKTMSMAVAAKEERAQFILSIVEWIRALYELNMAWISYVQGSNKTTTTASSSTTSLPSSTSTPSISMSVSNNTITSTTMSTSTSTSTTTQYESMPPMTRMFMMNTSKKRGILPEILRLEMDGGDRSLNAWLWISHAIIVGLKTASLLAETDEADLKCLVDRLRLVKSEEIMDSIPLFDEDKYAYIEKKLSIILEGEYWMNVDNATKEHCISLFIDFLYRNWTTHPLVLDMFSYQLKTMPFSMQFAIVQSLSLAVSRLHQEAIVLLVRHAFYESIQLGHISHIISDNNNNNTNNTDNTSSDDNTFLPPPPPLLRSTNKTSDTNKDKTVDRRTTATTTAATASAAATAAAAEVTTKTSRTGVDSWRFKPQRSEWKHAQIESRDGAAIDQLKEELSSACFTARDLANSFSTGQEVSSIGLDDTLFVLPFARRCEGEATKSLLLDQMWLSALGVGGAGAAFSGGGGVGVGDKNNVSKLTSRNPSLKRFFQFSVQYEYFQRFHSFELPLNAAPYLAPKTPILTLSSVSFPSEVAGVATLISRSLLAVSIL